MTETEYEFFNNPTVISAVVSAGMLKDTTPRTLIWGYTTDRDSFHVYLDAEKTLHKVVYAYNKEILLCKSEKSLDAEECVPNKRVYPQHCDYEFCKLLHSLHVNIPFTTFDAKPDERGPFKGELIADLLELEAKAASK